MHGFGIKTTSQNREQPDIEIELARQEREQRRMRAKVRAKERKEAILEAERLRAEQEKKDAEEELKNAREEAESAERKQVCAPSNIISHLIDADFLYCWHFIIFDIRLATNAVWKRSSAMHAARLRISRQNSIENGKDSSRISVSNGSN